MPVRIVALLIAACGAVVVASQSRTATPAHRVGSLAAVVRAETPSTQLAAAAAPEGSGRSFGVACEADAECASNVCSKGKRNGFCSMHCEVDKDCPTPPTAGTCNGRGFCKKAGS